MPMAMVTRTEDDTFQDPLVSYHYIAPDQTIEGTVEGFPEDALKDIDVTVYRQYIGVTKMNLDEAKALHQVLGSLIELWESHG